MAGKATKRRRRKVLEETALAEYERVIKPKALAREMYANPKKALPEFIKVTSGTLITTRRDSPKPAAIDAQWLRELRDERIANERHRLPQNFYLSPQWEMLRRNTLRRYGLKCLRCGAENVVLQVDHIKPRSAYPRLALDPDKITCKCYACHATPGNPICEL